MRGAAWSKVFHVFVLRTALKCLLRATGLEAKLRPRQTSTVRAGQYRGYSRPASTTPPIHYLRTPTYDLAGLGTPYRYNHNLVGWLFKIKIRADLLAYFFCTYENQVRDKGLPSVQLYRFDDWRGQEA